MDSTSRQIIKLNENFIKNLDLEKIKPYLEKSKIFTKSMLRDIYANDSECNLVSELPTRGPNAFQLFLEVLENAGYINEVRMLKNSSPSSFLKRKNKMSFYTMKSDPLGYCLIINNVTFDSLDYREGSDVDARNLRKLFESFGFKVHVETNLRGQFMRSIFKTLSASEELKSMDCLFVIILSHGDSGGVIYGTDSFELTKSEIYNIFNNINCPYLRNKPKIFLFQACRGKREDPGVPSTESTDSTDSLNDQGKNLADLPQAPSKKLIMTESNDSVAVKIGEDDKQLAKSSDTTTQNKLPTISDVLIVHSSLPDHRAYRDHFLGSWLIQDLVSVFSKSHLEQDLEAMLKTVYKKIQDRLSLKEQNKQVPCSENIGFHKYLHLCTNEKYEGCDPLLREYLF